jgi:hypothetical protein
LKFDGLLFEKWKGFLKMQFELEQTITDLILVAAASKLPPNAPFELVGAMDRLRELAKQLGLPNNR